MAARRVPTEDFLCLGLDAAQPRKGLEGLVWFREPAPPDRCQPILDLVPEAFRHAARWVAPRVLALGTADDIRHWTRKAGGWPALRDSLRSSLAEMHRTQPVAFFASSNGFAARRVAKRIVSEVLPALEAHFHEQPVTSSVDSTDPGVWTLYYAVNGATPRNAALPERDRWHAAFRAASGRSYFLDWHMAEVLGAELQEEAVAKDDALTILSFPYRLPVDVDFAALVDRVIDQQLASAAWIHEMMAMLVPRFAGLEQLDEPREAEGRRLDRGRLEVAWAVLRRFADLGPSPRWEPAAGKAHCVARAMGSWENELRIVVLARGLPREDPNGFWGRTMARDVLAKALEVGDERTVEAQLVEVLALRPTDASLVEVTLRALLARGRTVEAMRIVRDYDAGENRVLETSDTLKLLLRALAENPEPTEEDERIAARVRFRR